MSISQRSMRVAFMQPRRGVKKKLNPNRSLGRLFNKSLLFRSVHAIAAFFVKFVHILVTDTNHRDFYHSMTAKYPV